VLLTTESFTLVSLIEEGFDSLDSSFESAKDSLELDSLVFVTDSELMFEFMEGGSTGCATSLLVDLE
jgi:hypothetical protein